MAKFNLCSVGVDLRGSKWLMVGGVSKCGIKYKLQSCNLENLKSTLGIVDLILTKHKNETVFGFWNIICPEVDESGFNCTVLGDIGKPQ